MAHLAMKRLVVQVWVIHSSLFKTNSQLRANTWSSAGTVNISTWEKLPHNQIIGEFTQVNLLVAYALFQATVQAEIFAVVLFSRISRSQTLAKISTSIYVYL